MTIWSSRISKEYYFCHAPWRCMNQRNKAPNPTITTSVMRHDIAWIKATSTQSYNYYFCHAPWHCMNQRNKHPILQLLLLPCAMTLHESKQQAPNPTITTSVTCRDVAWIKATSTQSYNYYFCQCAMMLHESKEQSTQFYKYYFCHALWQCMNQRNKAPNPTITTSVKRYDTA